MACMSNGEFDVATADVKDAFLMVPQPEDEKVAIMCGDWSLGPSQLDMALLHPGDLEGNEPEEEDSDAR